MDLSYYVHCSAKHRVTESVYGNKMCVRSSQVHAATAAYTYNCAYIQRQITFTRHVAIALHPKSRKSDTIRTLPTAHQFDINIITVNSKFSVK